MMTSAAVRRCDGLTIFSLRDHDNYRIRALLYADKPNWPVLNSIIVRWADLSRCWPLSGQSFCCLPGVTHRNCST
jgi:hypothetical protein